MVCVDGVTDTVCVADTVRVLDAVRDTDGEPLSDAVPDAVMEVVDDSVGFDPVLLLLPDGVSDVLRLRVTDRDSLPLQLRDCVFDAG